MGQKLVRLAVKGDYRNRDVAYLKGQTIEVPQSEADFLLRDAPGCFGKPTVVEPPKAKEVEEPEVNKMVDEPEESKGDKKNK